MKKGPAGPFCLAGDLQPLERVDGGRLGFGFLDQHGTMPLVGCPKQFLDDLLLLGRDELHGKSDFELANGGAFGLSLAEDPFDEGLDLYPLLTGLQLALALFLISTLRRLPVG